MKMVGLREAKAMLSACIDSAQEERIVITRHGRPVALVIGLEGETLEDVLLAADPRFWTMIEEPRKRSSTVSEAQARKILGVGREQSGRGRKPQSLERRPNVGRRRGQKSSKRVT